MQIQVVKLINSTTYKVNVSDQNDIEALAKAGVFASMPDICKLCGSERVHLASNKAKGYTFVKMLCEKCDARSQLGQYKDGGFFWKKWEQYVAPAQGGGQTPTSSKLKTIQEEEPQE